MPRPATNVNPPLRAVYRALHRHFGPQHWWPGRTRFEVIVGAILTQNTAWSNVEQAIARLRAAKA
jgi:endonuclease-3 related protein